MGSSTLISVSEYLNTTYRPDRDYVDGEVRERNWGERPHSLLQALLAAIFMANRKAWNVLVMPEHRVQTSAAHFRVPDLCVIQRNDPADAIVHTAPLICVEILSRDDTLRELQERVDHYIGMGVEHVWVTDPIRRIAYQGSTSGFVRPEAGRFVVPGTPIEIDLASLFAELDDLAPA